MYVFGMQRQVNSFALYQPEKRQRSPGVPTEGNWRSASFSDWRFGIRQPGKV